MFGGGGQGGEDWPLCFNALERPEWLSARNCFWVPSPILEQQGS